MSDLGGSKHLGCPDYGERDWAGLAEHVASRCGRRAGRHRGDPDVMDHTQEVLVRVIARINKHPEIFDSPEGFGTFVSGVIKFVARERHRQLLKSRALLDKIGRDLDRFSTTADLPSALAWRDSYPLIRVAVVHRSGEVSIRAFDMLNLEDFEVEEVAARLDLTKQAVYSINFNVRQRFIEERKFLDLEGVLKYKWPEAAIQRAVKGARDRCLAGIRPIIDALYINAPSGDLMRPDKVAADPRMIFRARAAFLKELRPIVVELCRREEGNWFED